MLILLFLLLLVATFSIVLYVTRPTKEEADLGDRLAGLSKGGSGSKAAANPDILNARPTATFRWSMQLCSGSSWPPISTP